jgi:jumonji domain-containing protein 7
MSNSQWIESYLQRVTKDYQDLNSSTVDFVDQIPSSVEFSRFVASNRPLIIRGRQKHQLALKKWSNDYLLQSMGENLVEIGVSRG